MPQYHIVGKASEFEPGVMKPVQLGSRDVAVVKIGDDFHAFSDFCPHEGITLTAGYGHVAREFVVCMMHSSVFRLDNGEVIAGPASDSLETFEVDVRGEDVIVKTN